MANEIRRFLPKPKPVGKLSKIHILRYDTDGMKVSRGSRSQQAVQEAAEEDRSDVAPLEDAVHQEVVQEAAFLQEEGQEEAAASGVEHHEEEAEALVAVVEVVVTDVYHTVDKYWSCFHEAFRDSQHRGRQDGNGGISARSKRLVLQDRRRRAETRLSCILFKGSSNAIPML